jgi:uncharacterized membrane protein
VTPGHPELLALHMIGLIMWLGGLLAALYIMRPLASIQHDDTGRVVQGLFHAIVHPGLLMVLATGIFLLFLKSHLLAERWFQVTLALFLTAVVVDVRTFRLAVGLGTAHRAASTRSFVALYVGLGIAVFGGLMLTLSRPW